MASCHYCNAERSNICKVRKMATRLCLEMAVPAFDSDGAWKMSSDIYEMLAEHCKMYQEINDENVDQ